MYKWILNKREYHPLAGHLLAKPAQDIPFCSIFLFFCNIHLYMIWHLKSITHDPAPKYLKIWPFFMILHKCTNWALLSINPPCNLRTTINEIIGGEDNDVFITKSSKTPSTITSPLQQQSTSYKEKSIMITLTLIIFMFACANIPSAIVRIMTNEKRRHEDWFQVNFILFKIL